MRIVWEREGSLFKVGDRQLYKNLSDSIRKEVDAVAQRLGLIIISISI